MIFAFIILKIKFWQKELIQVFLQCFKWFLKIQHYIVELLLSQKGIDLDIKIIFIYLIDTISKYINQSNFIFLYYNSVLKLIF